MPNVELTEKDSRELLLAGLVLWAQKNHLSMRDKLIKQNPNAGKTAFEEGHQHATAQFIAHIQLIARI